MLGSFKKRGFIYSFAILFNKLVPAALFRFGVMDVYQLCDEKLSPEPLASDVYLTLAEDVALRKKLKSVTQNSLSEAATNSHWAVAIEDAASKKLIGGLWVAQESFTETSLNCRFQFAPDQAWVYCAYLDKDHRRQGYYSAALRFTWSELAKKPEPAKLLVAFNPFNKASAKAHRKFTGTRLGRVYSICFFKKALCFRTGDIQQEGVFGTVARPVEFLCR